MYTPDLLSPHFVGQTEHMMCMIYFCESLIQNGSLKLVGISTQNNGCHGYGISSYKNPVVDFVLV